MALPTISGRGFIISEIELKFLASGQAVANFAVAFNKSKKNDATGEWDRTHEIVVRATAWGELAEFIAEKFTSKTDIDLTGEIYTETFQRKDGSEGSSTCMTVRSVGAPVARREARSGGGSGNGGFPGGSGGDAWGSNPASNPSNDW